MSGALSLGWRNIWRNRRRTLISMSAIGLGLFLVIVYGGLMGGLLAGAKNQLDDGGMGHVEVFATGYRARHEVGRSMTDVAAVKAALKLPADAEVGERVLARGLATSARGSEPVQVYGVEWADEAKLATHLRQVKSGALPKSDDATGVLVGEELAERLGLKVGAKVRLMVQRTDGEMGADLFRVRGIFHSIAPAIGQRQVYVNQAAAQELIGLSGGWHQVVIQLSDPAQADAVAAQLKTALGPGYEVLTWGELLPVLKKLEALSHSVMVLMSFFVYLLVGLGVLNTMLMSVLERTREFGVLLSLGTRPRRIVQIVLAESFWTATVSAFIGGALGAYLSWHLSKVGVQMPTGGESYQMGGATVATFVKTRFQLSDVLKAGSFVFAMALIVGLYPASRITRLQPAEALRRT